MTTAAHERSRRWPRILERIAAEFAALPPAERQWLSPRLAEMGELRGELDTLFRSGGGMAACADCGGDCCLKGHNHLTLADLLGWLNAGEPLPEADFFSSCPFLSAAGCALPVARRPYNCISFVCDRIENSLTAAQRDLFYQQEKRLRALYLEFAARYAGGGLTGLLLQDEQLAGHPFLSHRSSGA